MSDNMLTSSGVNYAVWQSVYVYILSVFL